MASSQQTSNEKKGTSASGLPARPPPSGQTRVTTDGMSVALDSTFF